MFIIHCPHCNIIIEILELNCRIFRCGIFKHSGLQLPPHTDKEACDYYKDNDLIYGCGKPFMIDINHDVKKCDYI
jgi:hypothetical protein